MGFSRWGTIIRLTWEGEHYRRGRMEETKQTFLLSLKLTWPTAMLPSFLRLDQGV